eukprot:Skav206708  [mRNA]  locus=scaffold99:232246:236479:+ [translate_table: standard]
MRVYDEVPLPEKTYWYRDEDETMRKELMQDLGCYCKSVSSMKDCPDSKTNKKKWQPEYARFFHPEESFEAGKPHLCCKFAWSAWYDRKGFGYRKATAEHCFSEVQSLKDRVVESLEKLDKDYLPEVLQSPDPEAANGSAAEYAWLRATAQWKKDPICKAHIIMPWIREKKYWYEAWNSLEKRFYRRESSVYEQTQKKECFSKELSRICPEGQGLYVKQLPWGTCTKEPGPTNSDQLQLESLGSGLMFQCPNGYQSGKKGAMKSDTRCHCDSC